MACISTNEYKHKYWRTPHCMKSAAERDVLVWYRIHTLDNQYVPSCCALSPRSHGVWLADGAPVCTYVGAGCRSEFSYCRINSAEGPVVCRDLCRVHLFYDFSIAAQVSVYIIMWKRMVGWDCVCLA